MGLWKPASMLMNLMCPCAPITTTLQAVATEAASASAVASEAERLQRRVAKSEACQARLRDANAMIEALAGPVRRLFMLIG